MPLPLLILHILGGTIGLLSGTLAIAVRKGSSLHRTSGNVFTVAMLMLASSGLYLAILKSQRGNIIGSIITFYLIATAWLAGRRSCTGRLDWAALVVGTGGAAAVITLGVQSLHSPDRNAPAGMAFFFSASCSC
jgi:quinol-cytochrome oxidoreductase complex cytochrome b subunit